MIENRPRFTAKLPIIHQYVLFSVNYCMQGNVCLWIFFSLLSHRSKFQCLNCVWVNSRLGEAFCKYRRPKLTQGEKTLCTVLHGILHLFRVLNSNAFKFNCFAFFFFTYTSKKLQTQIFSAIKSKVVSRFASSWEFSII